MPVTLELHENGHILVYTISGRWDVHEITALFPQEKAIRDKATHLIHAIVDVRLMQNIPGGMLSVRQNPVLGHPTAGYVAFIGVSPMGRIMIDGVYRILGFDHYRFFKTDDEAWTFLRQMIAAEQPSAL